jgi:glutamate--cysteine ligase
MSSDVERASPPITSVDELVDLLRSGEKSGDLRVGAEHEKLPFVEATLAPADYEHGIKPLLLALTRYGWEPKPDLEQPISLSRGGASITLEPGGQFELSGAPQPTMHDVASELYEHLVELFAVSAPLGLRCSSLALRPRESTATAPWMPKPRYEVMRDYLPKKGRRGLDMMLLTATVQANFDFTSEADMATKMRTAMAVSPVVAAISANSPYSLGSWSGYRSRRYAVWREVDPDRCGLLPFVFEPDFGYRDYVEWALDVPMIFVRRGGAYVEGDGVRTFRQFWGEGQNGDQATLADFQNHLSTLFPEVRLKSYLEVRSADACPPIYSLGLIALWKGLLYDPAACADAFALVADLSFAERQAMQFAAAQDALGGHGPGWHLGELASELVRLARQGLARQARTDLLGRDETIYLGPLEELVHTRQTLADRMVARHGAGPLDEQTLRLLISGTACQATLGQLEAVARPAPRPVGGLGTA